MSLHLSPRRLGLSLAVAGLVALSLTTAPAAHAQALFAFTGGNGAPLGVTLLAPVTYTVNATTSKPTPFFIFDGVGDVIGGSTFTGTWTYSINGGTPQTLLSLASGVAAGDVSADDLYGYGAFSVLTPGDTLTLNAASILTDNNSPVPAPANGSYPTFITDGDGTAMSGNGLAVVPEPGTFALLGLGVLPLAGMLARRRLILPKAKQG